ncbi:MAG: DUF456 domain-containing protein [Patescibacteria group bacterium]|jgi:hypothetical protein
MTAGEIMIFILTVLVMLVGLLGVVLPVLPDVPLIFAAVFAYALIDHFTTIGWGLLGVFAFLTAITLMLDWLGTIYGVKKMGGSSLGMIGAVAGMLIGLFTGGIIGVIIGSFLGAYLLELAGGKNNQSALRAGFGSFIGFITGGLIKFIIGAIIIGIFIWQVLF